MRPRLGSLLAVFAASVFAADDRPSVVFIFADDQQADTIRALGNPHIRTPNLDRLAARGVAFDRAYMQGGLHGATCVPSRAMLLSARPLFRSDEKLARDPTWPAAFGAAGYRTFVSGKWHNGAASVPLSFQRATSMFTGGMTNPMKASLSSWEHGKQGPARVEPRHACEAFAEAVVAFLREPGEGPSFAYLPFDGPHDPHIVPDDFPEKYDPAALPLPPNFLPQHPFDNGEMTIRDEALLPWPRTSADIRGMLAEYYRYITYLDLLIGRVIDAVDASPRARNTIIVFTADSGVARGSHGLIGKQNLYEHSVRVPLIVAGPGIPAGRRTAAMCYLFDLMPTLGALCSVPAPATSEGRDLSAVLRDPSRGGREALMFAYRDVQRGVRDERWKLIRYPQVDRTQLFDLAADPHELRDLSAEPAHGTRIAQLTARLESEMKSFGDPASLRVAQPKPAAWSPPAKGTGGRAGKKTAKSE
ncbi:MAG: sulfatase-like hydrolase/transferase [Opitutaceae bacterium]|nr:sulfatase-like hydrolase/transferase [Opitutaceae bacterium]